MAFRQSVGCLTVDPLTELMGKNTTTMTCATQKSSLVAQKNLMRKFRPAALIAKRNYLRQSSWASAWDLAAQIEQYLLKIGLDVEDEVMKMSEG